MGLPFFSSRPAVDVSLLQSKDERGMKLAAQKAEVLRRMKIVCVATDAWAAERPAAAPFGPRSTRELLQELETPTTHTMLCIRIGNFLRTMVGYENNLLGLEENGQLPANFAVETYHALLELSRLLPPPVHKEVQDFIERRRAAEG